MLSLALGAVLLVGCSRDTPDEAQIVPFAAAAPNGPCQDGWTRLSSQWWAQDDRDGDGAVDFPQSLRNGPGGHLHVETCFPANQRVDGTLTFHVDLMSHQGFVGEGDRLDIGLAPGGSSQASVDAPDMHCGPAPKMCHGKVSISLDTDRLPDGLQSLRFRYLPAHLPGGERVFVGTEWPLFVRTDPSECGQIGGKGWMGDYANARWDGCLPNGPVSGTIDIPVFTKGPVARASVHVDARFGSDDEGRVVATRPGEFRGDVPLDTTTLTNGWHCVAIRADSPVGGGRVNVGIIELPLLVHNPGEFSARGRGSCFAR